MTDKPFASGHCLCGKVNYTVAQAPIKMAQCHCDDCSRSTGTGHASNVFFNKDDVVVEGDTQSFGSTTDTGSLLTRHFCPNCGSRLFGTNSMSPNIISVAAGSFNDNSWFKPNLIVYNKRKPDWDYMDESIPKFEEMPPMAPKK